MSVIRNVLYHEIISHAVLPAIPLLPQLTAPRSTMGLLKTTQVRNDQNVSQSLEVNPQQLSQTKYANILQRSAVPHWGYVHTETSPSPSFRLRLVCHLYKLQPHDRNRIERMPCEKSITIFYYFVNYFTNRASLIMNNSAMTIYDVKYASWPV